MTRTGPDELPDQTESECDEIACPWCNAPFRDLWEWFYDEPDRVVTDTCDRCGRDVEFSCEMTWLYTAAPVPPKEKP